MSFKSDLSTNIVDINNLFGIATKHLFGGIS